MTEIVKAIHPRLKDAGFRKRRHTFNRSAEPGVVQVINFQMGQKLPPGAEPIAGLRPDLHGRFTVNLGIAIEEAWLLSRREQDVEFPAVLNDYDCDIRERLGQLLGERHDVWWSLGENQDKLAATIGDAIVGTAGEWLAARGTRDGILTIWAQGGLSALPTPTALPIVMILRRLDRPAQAEEALRSYYSGVSLEPHRRYVHSVAHHLGIELPNPE